jgi:hypothetical protein
MMFEIRNWVVLSSLCLGSTVALAQTPAMLPGAPIAPAPSAAGVSGAVGAGAPAALPALLRPSEVKESYKNYLYQRYANDKEARAAVHLFSRKQVGGGIWLGTGAVVIGFIASQTGTTTSSSGTTTFNVTPLGYGVLVGLFGGVGAGKLLRFNNEKLFEALMEYDQQGHLPSRVVNRLKSKDYR